MFSKACTDMQEEEAGKLEKGRRCRPVSVEKSWTLYMTAALAQKYLIHVKRQYDNGSFRCSTTKYNQTLNIR